MYAITPFNQRSTHACTTSVCSSPHSAFCSTGSKRKASESGGSDSDGSSSSSAAATVVVVASRKGPSVPLRTIEIAARLEKPLQSFEPESQPFKASTPRTPVLKPTPVKRKPTAAPSAAAGEEDVLAALYLLSQPSLFPSSSSSTGDRVSPAVSTGSTASAVSDSDCDVNVDEVDLEFNPELGLTALRANSGGSMVARKRSRGNSSSSDCDGVVVLSVKSA